MTKRLLRSEVPVEQTWDLTDLFPNDEAWERALNDLKDSAEKVLAFKGKLAESADVLHEALTAVQDFQKEVIPVATYASLKASADGTNPENQGNAARVSATMARLGAELSFVESELLTIPSDVIKGFLAEKEELQTFEKHLEDLLEKKPFILSPEIEETLAALSEVHGSP